MLSKPRPRWWHGHSGGNDRNGKSHRGGMTGMAIAVIDARKKTKSSALATVAVAKLYINTEA